MPRHLVTTAFLLATATTAATTAASASPAVGLVGDRTLVLFDTDTRAVSGAMEVEGVDRLLGIDVRPADGTLVGVTADFTIVTIDTASGGVSELSRMDAPLPDQGLPYVVDFNPVADRLRFMSGATNHRVDVDTGAVTVDGSLAFDAADMHAGEPPAIVAAAYTNARGRPEATAMYDIDASVGALVRQTSPNDGTLATVGMLGIANPDASVAFDVGTGDDMTNTAFLVTGGTLYTVDLETGAASAAGAIEGVDGSIRDITFLP